MSEISEAIQEAVEKGRESKFNSIVAVLVALTATFMALCHVKSGNIIQRMQHTQSNAVDAWSYYQAKSTKQELAEATLDQLQVDRELGSGNAPAFAMIDARIVDFQKRVKRYDGEKAAIRKEAEDDQKQYESLDFHHDQLDLSEAALSVTIALLGITALTQKRWLLVVAIVFMIFGVVMGLAGFAGWSLHPDALIHWLT